MMDETTLYVKPNVIFSFGVTKYTVNVGVGLDHSACFGYQTHFKCRFYPKYSN
jgi:hypothetical protein